MSLTEIFGWIVGIGTVIGAVIAFLPNLKASWEWFRQIGKKKRDQPKLAINIINGGRGRMRANATVYHPFELSEDRVITFEQQQLLSFDWDLSWRFTLKITNQSEFAAYQVKVIPFMEQGVTMHLDPKIDFTTPFVFNKTETYEVVCRRTYRCKPEEADAIIAEYPFGRFQIEYANAHGVKFITSYNPKEIDEKKNSFFLKMAN